MISILQSYAAIPLVALVVFGVLVVIARPDRDEGGDGLYAVYLSVVGIAAMLPRAGVRRALREARSPNG